MDSFFLAEMFKYLYLLFADKEDLTFDIEDYIFTTEAHLLPLWLSTTNQTAPRKNIVSVAIHLLLQKVSCFMIPDINIHQTMSVCYINTKKILLKSFRYIINHKREKCAHYLEIYHSSISYTGPIIFVDLSAVTSVLNL